ncbi:MAG: NAD-dependent dihydroorotate dehydrogenase B electron transfer subunit, partial [Candidatus Omnitrophica bacterium]|nr:NAD-dependent dihydroorotate dehydrogenase B electron transfer subunit [Candidatus Omnitrophota bacterium]
MKHKSLQVISKKILNDRYVELVVENRLEPFPKPGQFLHILTMGTFMRRPLSIANCTKERMKLIFQIRGPGTRKLSEVNEGMKLDILGPLGNGFPAVRRKGTIYLVAGGIGVAPL